MSQEEFPPGLSYQVRIPSKCLSIVSFSALYQGGTSHLLELGGLPGFALGVVPPRDVLSIGSGEGCCLLGLGDCLGIGVGGAVEVGCSSTVEALCSGASGGNGGVFPNKIW